MGGRSRAVRAISCRRGVLDAHPATRPPPERRAVRPSRRPGRAAAIVLPHRPRRRQPSATCPRANWILPASRVACAVDCGSRRSLLASTSRASARSTIPASRWACAADSRRSARRSSIGRQQRRAFQERSRGGIATTAPGLVGCRRQLGRDPFVGPGGGCGQMPGPGNYVDVPDRRPPRGPGGPAAAGPRSRRGRPPTGRAGGRTAPPARRPPVRRPPPAPRRTPGCPARWPPATGDHPGPAGPPMPATAASACRQGSSRTRRTNRTVRAGDRRAAARAAALVRRVAPGSARGRLRRWRAGCHRSRRRFAPPLPRRPVG